MKVKIKRLNEHYLLEAQNADGNRMLMDANPSIGGTGAGVRPMEVVLMSLAGCSSIDVLSILKKSRQVATNFNVEVDAERADAVPAVFTKIHVEYQIEGDVDVDKAKRAIELSMTKYCSVTKMLEPTVEITHALRLNGELMN
ncbi:OsmC family peroxiredoxin [bacterium]|nr:MAG: OsmC family peroxiredoxin [bacterium]